MGLYKGVYRDYYTGHQGDVRSVGYGSNVQHASGRQDRGEEGF